MGKKGNVRYETGRLYGSQARADVVSRIEPRQKGKGVIVKDVASFPVDDKSERKASDYASELQRETRGYAKGGSVRGTGCATKGKKFSGTY